MKIEKERIISTGSQLTVSFAGSILEMAQPCGLSIKDTLAAIHKSSNNGSNEASRGLSNLIG
jgi:hypothetical protein